MNRPVRVMAADTLTQGALRRPCPGRGTVTWTARCPHGRDTEWHARYVEGLLPGDGAHLVVSCPCTCTEPPP